MGAVGSTPEQCGVDAQVADGFGFAPSFPPQGQVRGSPHMHREADGAEAGGQSDPEAGCQGQGLPGLGQGGGLLLATVRVVGGSVTLRCCDSLSLSPYWWLTPGAAMGLLRQEMVLLEIDVMNQLNHRNLIQLYDAIETPREIILFMEL